MNFIKIKILRVKAFYLKKLINFASFFTCNCTETVNSLSLTHVIRLDYHGFLIKEEQKPVNLIKPAKTTKETKQTKLAIRLLCDTK